MLKPVLIATIAMSGLTAAPALADDDDDDRRWRGQAEQHYGKYERKHDRWHQRNDRRHDRYDRYQEVRLERQQARAYRLGMRHGENGWKREDRQFRDKAVRNAYRAGYKEGRDEYRRYARYDRRYDRGYERDYDRRYDDYRPIYYRRASDVSGGWYGRDNRYYGSYDDCRRRSGLDINTGTIIGGVLGAVAGNRVAGEGSRTAGTVVGAAVGGLIGHEVGKKGDSRRYCY